MTRKKTVKANKESQSHVPSKLKQRKIEIKSENSDDSDESEDESVSDNISMRKTKSSADINNETTDVTKSEKLKDKIIKTQKKKIVGGTSKLKSIVKVSSPFISSSESEEDDEDDDTATGMTTKPKKAKNTFTSTTSDESLDTSKEKNKLVTKRKTSKSKKKPQKIKKRKKTLRDEFNMDIRDMIVKKRIASLNASAIMSASYSSVQNEKVKMNELGVHTYVFRRYRQNRLSCLAG